MKVSGNIRKMRSELTDEEVLYKLPLFDILEPNEEVDMNGFIGNTIKLTFENAIHCVVTGNKINKAYGEGMSYDAFMTSPYAVESIIRPELSMAHLGIALRDLEWETQHDVQPHIVYLSKTSGIKVGVTRKTQVPTRWIDQGAHEAIVLAETPYRQAAGLIEVALKDHMDDKTNWRMMLKNENSTTESLEDAKARVAKLIPEDLQQFIAKDTSIQKITFPVLDYPTKVTSMKFDKMPIIEKKLSGIKGQYLIFDDNTVINLRSHTGYRISIEA